MSKTIRIGNGAGFLGDNLDAPRRLAEQGALDYLTLEHLAELTMSVLARLRQKDPKAGYAADFLAILSDLLPVLRAQPSLKIVANSGGVNPVACARAAGAILADAGLGETPIGVVTGDDLLSRMSELRHAGSPLSNLDDGRAFADLKESVVSANAYLGAQPIASALAEGARIVITGRVADASLTVGPAMHEFGWSWEDWNRLAAASVIGHVIECGAQATGGYFGDWKNMKLADVGYPIAELSDDGAAVITKPAGTGGRVNRHVIAEQLVYEIGDPRRYLTPDVTVDFTTVEIAETGLDRVTITGASGVPPPDTYKVSLAYDAGWFAAGELLVWGGECAAKARAVVEVIFGRLRAAGCVPEIANWELLGAGAGVPGLAATPHDLSEVVLRVAASDPRRDVIERFTREFAPLATSGPAGLAGYTTARGSVRPMFAYWPTTVPKSLATPRHEVLSARQWVGGAR